MQITSCFRWVLPIQYALSNIMIGYRWLAVKDRSVQKSLIRIIECGDWRLILAKDIGKVHKNIRNYDLPQSLHASTCFELKHRSLPVYAHHTGCTLKKFFGSIIRIKFVSYQFHPEDILHDNNSSLKFEKSTYTKGSTFPPSPHASCFTLLPSFVVHVLCRWSQRKIQPGIPHSTSTSAS